MLINLPSRLFTCNIQADNEAGSNVLYTSDRIVGKVQGWNQCAVILRIGLLVRFKDRANVLYT